MTFTQLVTKVMDRLNLSSPAAETRVEELINEGYKEVTSSIGVLVGRRVDITFTLDADVDTDLPVYVVEGMEKVLRIQLLDSDGKPTRDLEELTYDEVTAIAPKTGLPMAFAVKTMGSQSVTVVFDAFPETDAFDIKIEGYDLADELTGSQVPAFPESFHDTLMWYAMYQHCLKFEKPGLAKDFEARYQQRVSDLRMFIAKSAYLDLYQSKDKYKFGSARNRWLRH